MRVETLTRQANPSSQSHGSEQKKKHKGTSVTFPLWKHLLPSHPLRQSLYGLVKSAEGAPPSSFQQSP
eukprot:2151641-Amphidinium_carterae.1